MKELILITILFITFLSSPTWSGTLTMDDLVEKEDLLFYKKFSIFSPLDFLYPFTGEISGLQSGSFKNGKREGLWVSYHKNGNIGIKEIYKDGKRDGFYEMYYEYGQLLDKGNYKNRSRDGLWETYYESGQLWYTSNYKDGGLNGLQVEYYQNGQLKMKGNLKFG